MSHETEFIKNELKKRGYPLENYVQSVLTDRKWRVQPHAYFLDRDTGMGRDLDLKAEWHFETSKPLLDVILQLLIQCKKLPGSAWVFFSYPESALLGSFIQDYGLGRFLGLSPALSSFNLKGTHFERTDATATNYCEILVDKKKSNKRIDNIWSCVISLIKATAHELRAQKRDIRRYLDGYATFEKVVEEPPFELHTILYPLIVFEGKIYACEFHGDEPELRESQYIQLLVDYQSGLYKGRFAIDVVTKAKFPEYLTEISGDIKVFEDYRKNVSEEYDKQLLRKLKTYYEMKMYQA